MLGRMKSLLSVVLFASLSAGLLHGQTAESRHDEICGKYAEVPLPTEAQQASQSKKWPDCESYKIYSGIGMAVDYAAARNCAWLERLAIEARIQPEEMIDAVMGGSAMLAVVYANGEGVEQDKPLALRLACEIGMPADGLNAIEALPDEAHLSGRKFKRCDYAYTTFDMNFCAAFASEIAAQKRQNRLDEISAPWPKAHRDAFAALEKAEKNYVEAHGGEVYQGGTIRVLRTNGVGERQKDKFLAAVEEFESGHLPWGTETDYK